MPDAEIFLIISEALELPGDYVLNADSMIEDVPGWDSFGWVSVIIALETHFGQPVSIEKVNQVRSVKDIPHLFEDN